MNSTQKIGKKRTWRFWTAWVVAVLLVLLIAVYFIVTSGAFFKGVILPRVSSALNADVTVSDAQISPFSHVVLRDLKVAPKGVAPLLSAASVTARYDLLAILRGDIRVNEVSVVSPTVTVVENADGTSNLDPLLKTKRPTTPPPQRAPGKPSAPPALDIKSIALKDATFRYVQSLKGGERQAIELGQVNVVIGNVKNGDTGKLDLSAVIAVEQPSNATVQARVSSAFTFQLAANLTPGVVQGATTLSIDKATGQYADLETLAAKLDCDVTSTQIKQLALAFTKAGARLGEVRVSGPFDAAKLEGKLNMEVASLDRRVLNLAGAFAGFDFGSTTVSTSNEVEFTKGGAVITVAGALDVARLQVARQGSTTPTLDLHGQYAVTVNRAEQSVLVNTLNVTGTQNQRPLLRAELAGPMLIAWGDASNAAGNATLNLTVTGLNLADWKAFATDYAPAGVANVTLKLVSQNGGKQLTFDFDGHVEGLSARVNKEQIPQVDVRLQATGRSADFKEFNLGECRFELTQQSQSVLAVSGTAKFDKVTNNADVQLAVQGALERLAKLAAPWVSAASAYAPAGKANVTLNLQAQGGTKQLAFDLDVRVDQLTAHVGSNQLAPVDVHLLTKGSGADLQRFGLTQCKLDVTQQGQPVLAASVNGGFDTAFTNADLQVAAQGVVNRLSLLYPLSDVACSAGSLALSSHISAQLQTLTVTGQVALADFTGGYGNYRFTNFGAALDLDVALKGRLLEFHKATGQLRQGTVAGGRWDASATYDLDKKTGEVSAKLADFTQGDLQPFLQPSLGDKKLVSIALNGTVSAGFNASGDATAKADVKLANLVVQDPMNKFPGTPLEAHLVIDAGASNKVATVRQALLALTPTPRAKNELQLTGTVDYSQTNAITGSIKLSADALDATAYYDLFAGTNKPSTAAATAKPDSVSAASPVGAKQAEQQEPAAVSVPVRNFTCELAVKQFYLRQLEVTNLQTTARLDASHVTVKPCDLTLNGAPITASVDLDLGVPGYKYEIAFRAERAPLAPLVNSFSPTYSEKAQGDLSANLQFKGAGITGPNLRKNLTGTATLSFTNANIAIVGPKAKAILTPIAIVLGAPQLLQSPLDYIMADVQIASGDITTRQFVAHSAAFRALSQGTIPIANVLTDSPLSQPVDIELAQNIASQLRFANLPTDGSYVKLPTFVHLAGTLGSPTAKTDKAVIAGLTVQGVAGAVGGRAGGILGAVGGLLSGQTPGTNAPSQQTPSQPLRFNPFNLLH
jgi:hypothetical protein